MARFRKRREGVAGPGVVVVRTRQVQVESESRQGKARVEPPRLSVSDCLLRPSLTITSKAVYSAPMQPIHINTIFCIYSSFEVALPEVVQCGILTIQPTEGEPEDDTTDP